MIAALILVVSLVFLTQFFIAYCRSLLARSFRAELSPEAHQVTGIEDHLVDGNDFRRLLGLVELCPEPGNDTFELSAVRMYYSLMNALRSVGSLVPNLRAWVDQERAACGYFAAVALDRRIAHNRGMLARQMNGI